MEFIPPSMYRQFKILHVFVLLIVICEQLLPTWTYLCGNLICPLGESLSYSDCLCRTALTLLLPNLVGILYQLWCMGELFLFLWYVVAD